MSKVKKRRKLTVLGRFVIILFIGVLFGASLGFYYRLTNDNVKKDDVKEQNQEEEAVVNKKKEMDASLVMVGDALIHSAVYEDAYTGSSYDFKPMLKEIKPMIKDYDLKYYNQETILGGTELGLSNYPRFNSPYEVGDAFIDAGFNLVSLATNHTMDKGEDRVSVSYLSKLKRLPQIQNQGIRPPRFRGDNRCLRCLRRRMEGTALGQRHHPGMRLCEKSHFHDSPALSGAAGFPCPQPAYPFQYSRSRLR